MAVLGMIGAAAAGSAIDAGLGMINQSAQNKYNKEAAKYSHELQKKMFDYTYNKTNTTAQMNQLRLNNLNPTLMYGSGGGGGTTTPSTGSANQEGVGMIQPSGLAKNLEAVMATKRFEKEIENLEADTKLKEAEAEKKAGVDTEKGNAEIKSIEAQIDKIGEEVKNFRTQRNLMDLEISVKKGEVEKIAEEIEKIKADKNLTEEQQNALKISTLQSVLTQQMQRAVMSGQLNVQKTEIDKMAAEIQQKWEELGVKKDTNDINQIFNNWKMNYPSLNEWAGGGLQKLEKGIKELIDKL